MFPFPKKPPTKVEIVKQGVSDAAQALLHAIPAEKIEDKFDELKKSAAQMAANAAQAAHNAGEAAVHKFDALHQELHHTAGQLSTDGAAKAQTAKEAARESALAAKERLQSHAATLKDSAATLQATLRDRASREAAAAAAASDAEIAKAEAKEAHTEAEIAAKLEAQTAKVAEKAAQEKTVKIEAEIAAQEHLEAAKIRAQDAKDKAKIEAHERAEAQAKAAKIEAERLKIAKIEAAKLEAAKIEAAKEKEKAQADKKLEAAAIAAAALAASKTKDAQEEIAQKSKREAKIEAKDRDLKVKAGKIEVAELDLRPAKPGSKTGEVEIEYTDTSSKWLWILTGLVAGALLALLFAPTSGRRSRAAIKDRLGKVGDGATDAATAASDKIVDIANRVEGLAAQVETKLAADATSEDDGTLADRVRSTLGHHEVAKSVDRINVDCAEGVVTLRNPLLDAATQATIIAAVKAVPGVKDVISDFLTDEKPVDPSTSVI